MSWILVNALIVFELYSCICIHEPKLYCVFMQYTWLLKNLHHFTIHIVD
jgi:hypothetical protein